MACDYDLGDFEQNIENLRSIVRKSFARIYASLKARELKTLRQIDAIHKQCQDDKDLKKICIQNIDINYDNESVLLENINKFGVIDFEKLNFESNIFTLEDYISPNDDHMYLYKTIEDVTKEEDTDNLEAIEEAALKEVTSTENCVCFVNIHTEDVSKKFRNLDALPVFVEIDKNLQPSVYNDNECSKSPEEVKDDSSDSEVKKINPTDDWLKTIKSQTEIEPTQVTDVMEHSSFDDFYVNCST